jgi:hypothetical protein
VSSVISAALPWVTKKDFIVCSQSEGPGQKPGPSDFLPRSYPDEANSTAENREQSHRRNPKAIISTPGQRTPNGDPFALV